MTSYYQRLDVCFAIFFNNYHMIKWILHLCSFN